MNDKVTTRSDNGDIQECVNGVCKIAKRSNGQVKSAVRTIINLIAPLLVASTEPRIMALGLALQAGSAAFLGKPNTRKGGTRT